MKLIGLLVLLSLVSLVEGEVVNSFNTCKQFFLGNIPPTVLTDQNNPDRYKKICQKYKNIPRYATLYDTKNKIPVYSAYRYKTDSKNEDSKNRDPSWMIEPQLDDTRASAEMAFSTAVNKKDRGQNQALDKDYTNSGYERAHLYPKCHNCNKNQAESTFTLTNAAPMTPEDNKDWYGQVEKVTANMIHNACEPGTAYVVTGVVPGDEWMEGDEWISKEEQDEQDGPAKKNKRTKRMTNAKMNDKKRGRAVVDDSKPQRVNVPSYIWSAACCKCRRDQTKYLSQAFLAATMTLRKTFDGPPKDGWKMLAKKMSVDDLNEKLSDLYFKEKNRFKVFGDVCGGNGTLKQKGRAEDERNHKDKNVETQ